MQKSDSTNVNERDTQPLPEPDTAHERNKAAPDSVDFGDPKEVWKDGETTPSGGTRRPAGGQRVADAGDVGGGTPSPYSKEAQADAVARQTKKPVSGD